MFRHPHFQEGIFQIETRTVRARERLPFTWHPLMFSLFLDIDGLMFMRIT